MSGTVLPGFHNKTRTIATQKLAKTRFEGVPDKNRVLGGKIHIFWRVSRGEIRILLAKYHVIGVA